MQGSQEPQAGDINCGEEIGKLPFWTRTVYFCLGGSWLLSLFGMDSLLGSNSSVVFDKYRVWTLFTANLFVDNLLFLFIVIYNFNSFLPALVLPTAFRKINSLHPCSSSGSSSTEHSFN
jgi:hypothetical protein